MTTEFKFGKTICVFCKGKIHSHNPVHVTSTTIEKFADAYAHQRCFKKA